MNIPRFSAPRTFAVQRLYTTSAPSAEAPVEQHHLGPGRHQYRTKQKSFNAMVPVVVLGGFAGSIAYLMMRKGGSANMTARFGNARVLTQAGLLGLVLGMTVYTAVVKE